jgi:periplasmic divalent cation tolerance protein
MKNYIIIETTYPNKSKAKDLISDIIGKRLASCIQLTEIESNYIWQEKIINEKEILLRIKTTKSNCDKISKIIKSSHPYQIPEIVVINFISNNKDYSDWMSLNLLDNK